MKNKQRGFTLIEAASAMLIGSMMLIGVTAMIDASMEDSKGQQAAMYQAQVVAAATKYINDFANYNALTTTLAVLPNWVVPTANLGLPATMASTNVYRQTPCVVVKLRGGTLDKLDVLVVTKGGDKIAPKDIAVIAAQAGPGNGYILDATPTTTKARGASWALDTAALGGFTSSCLAGTAAADSGHLASALFFDSPGQLSTDFLYRDLIPGRPALNAMNTPLRMANTAVVPAADVAAGTACTAKAIAMDDNGELLQCGSDDGKWAYVSQWKAPKDNYTALTNLTTKQKGDVRMAKDIGKAFMYDGNKWVALAVDQNGDLSVKRNLTVVEGSIAVGDVSGLPSIQPGDIHANRDVHAGQEMRTTWLIVESTVTAEALYMNFNNEIGNWNGAPCNFPLTDRFGNPYRGWPVGTITAEGGHYWKRDGAGNPSYGFPNWGSGANTGKTLYCGNDETWHYVNP